ncbi:MAG TPA: GNAT family N-acetyltransferase, partial [Actinomycetota bacterium]|nr:GNAT family N-acetyltransferase [Actinomycetota bacterium]
LVDAARRRAAQGSAVLDLRTPRNLGVDLQVSLDKVTMVLGLPSSAEELWATLPAERRNRVKKAKREGLTVAVHGPDALNDFYSVFARNMRDLGSPVHARRFFAEMFAALGDRARFVVVRDGRRPVGAAVMVRHREVVTVPWVSSLRESFQKCPNQLLYWHAMEHSIAEGAARFDFGRSSIGTGTLEAKRQWGAKPEQQYWYYYPETATSASLNARRFDRVMRVWRHVPLPAANAIGPRIRGWISN